MDFPNLKALSSLELVFAKIHYDQNARDDHDEPTEAAIYFEKSYSYQNLQSKHLSSTNSLISFYNWLNEDLLKFPQFRELLQWNFLSTKTNYGRKNEVSHEEKFDHLRVEIFKYSSIKSFIDDFIGLKTENVINTFEGLIQTGIIEYVKEILNVPKILCFQLLRVFEDSDSFEEPNPSLSIFSVEESLIINSETFDLVSVIFYDEMQKTFNVCVKLNNQWHKIQGETSQKVTKETVWYLASKFGEIIFYLNQSTSLACPYKSPSQQLIIDSLTCNTIHNIHKSVQKYSTINKSQSITSSSSSFSHPTKSKSMMRNSSNSNFDNNYQSTDCSTFINSNSNSNHFPLKSSPFSDLELAQLNSLLIPYDLSNVKMNLITTPHKCNDDFEAELKAEKCSKKKIFHIHSQRLKEDEYYSNEDIESNANHHIREYHSSENEIKSENNDLRNASYNNEDIKLFEKFEILDKESAKIRKYTYKYDSSSSDDNDDHGFKNVNKFSSQKTNRKEKTNRKAPYLAYYQSKYKLKDDHACRSTDQLQNEALEVASNDLKKEDLKKKKFTRSNYAKF